MHISRMSRWLTLGALALALVTTTVMTTPATYADSAKDPRPPATTPATKPPTKAKIAPTGLPAARVVQANVQPGTATQALTLPPTETASIWVDKTFYPVYSPVNVCYSVSTPAYISIWDYVTGTWLVYDQYTPGGSCFWAYATPPTGWDYLYIYAADAYTGSTTYSFSDWFYVYY